MKELSSPLTFFYKYIFILLWFAGFGYGIREVLLTSQPFDSRWIQFVSIWLGVTIFIFFTTGNVKKVCIDSKKLYISNFLRSEEIDLSCVAGVDGSSFLSPKLVWFNLKEDQGLGKKIVFLPKHRIGSGLGKHPLVEELRQELGLKV